MGEDDGDAVWVRVGRSVGGGVAVDVEVGRGDVELGDGLPVGREVPDEVGVGVGVWSARTGAMALGGRVVVPAAVGEPVGDGDRVGVGLGDEVAVPVGLGVDVPVAVGLGDEVPVGRGLAVPVGEGERVGGGVALPLRHSAAAATPTRLWGPGTPTFSTATQATTTTAAVAPRRSARKLIRLHLLVIVG